MNQVRRWFVAIAILVVLMAAQLVQAGTTAIDPVLLTGASATWDPEGNFTYNFQSPGTGPCISGRGFSPAVHGVFGSDTDAFDGGLYLVVNNKTFGKGLEQGSLSGQTLRVGPQTVNQVSIRRTERALQGSPTLRSLIRFKNATDDARKLVLVWDSALGSDDTEATRASSDGDTAHEENDRWIVSSDSPATPGDATATFVFFGTGPGEKVVKVLYAPEDIQSDGSPGDGCVAVRYRIKVPAGKVRYMLFFTEMWDTNQTAAAGAAKFNNVGQNSPLLAGLSDGVRSKILNWDLA